MNSMSTMPATTHETCVPVDLEYLSEGLDELGIGLLAFDQNECLTYSNQSAVDMVALDKVDSDERPHLVQMADVFGSSLSTAVEEVRQNGSRSVRHGLHCSNRHGRHMLIDLSCLPFCGMNNDPCVICLLHDVRQRHQFSDDTKFLRQELQILTDVAAALSSSSELVQILKVILTGATAAQGLGFNRAFLFLYQQDTNELIGHMALGPVSAEEAGSIWKDLDAMRLSLEELLEDNQSDTDEGLDALTDLITDFRVRLDDESAIGRACHDSSWLNLAISDDTDNLTSAFARRLNTDKLALVPMVSKGHLMGLLAADNQITGRPISDEAVQLLQALANQAAVAMERARLYDNQLERSRELERINQLLAESQDQIIKIEKMSVIGELTSAITHELRNPLTVVGGFANLMLKSTLPDENREYLNIISSEIRRAETVLDQVLDFSRASKGENCPIDFSGLVKRSLDLLKGRLARRELPMFLSRASEPLTVFGNSDQLSHAVYQFLKLVAEELTPPGEAEVRTELRDGQALMLIKIRRPDHEREQVRRTLERIITQNRSSQRLTILVAGETIRYHGGNFGIACGDDSLPSLYIELPVMKERPSEPAHTGG